MTIYHLLNGDCLADQLKLTQLSKNFIICRECLIDGKVHAKTISDFWDIRSEFIASNFHVSKEVYYNKTVSEFEKLFNLPDHSEICLWFENDLFCQVNMWFTLYLLSNFPTYTVYRLFPIIEKKDEIWAGFATSNPEHLEKSFQQRILFTPEDITLGKNLWIAYQNNDFEKLKELSITKSNCFENLNDVCIAHVERFPSDNSLGRPEKMIKELIETKSKEFAVVFSEFVKREGIYGFGDLQIKKKYDEIINSLSK